MGWMAWPPAGRCGALIPQPCHHTATTISTGSQNVLDDAMVSRDCGAQAPRGRRAEAVVLLQQTKQPFPWGCPLIAVPAPLAQPSGSRSQVSLTLAGPELRGNEPSIKWNYERPHHERRTVGSS